MSEAGFKGHGERLARLETRMITVEEGVSNFRAHTERANRFFDRQEAATETIEKRRKRNLSIALVLIPILASALGWGIFNGARMIIEILRIEQNWKQTHPSEFVRPETMFSSPDPAYASTREQVQDYGKACYEKGVADSR